MTNHVEKKNKALGQRLLIIGAVLSSILILILRWAVQPIYTPYDSGKLQFESQTDGSVVMTVSASVAGYDLVSMPDSNSYFVTTWDSIWNQHVHTEQTRRVVLMPEQGQQSLSVYYYNAYDGSELSSDHSKSQLIYGEDSFDGGGVILLPRLALNYYLVLSLVLGVLLLIIWYFKRMKLGFVKWMPYIVPIPFAYAISHVLIKGGAGISYALQFDLLSILLLAIPLYFLWMLMMKRMRISKSM
jgi:hypothetical protein